MKLANLSVCKGTSKLLGKQFWKELTEIFLQRGSFSKRLHPVLQGLINMIFNLQVVGEITRSILAEEPNPVDGCDISSLILIDRG